MIGSENLTEKEYVIALAGNPNVGKSTIFNALTGLHQHTGNWPGKTVGSAQGKFQIHGVSYRLVDIPGTYSLFAHSKEEEIARDFLCFERPDAVIAVCDAVCLERSLPLALNIAELVPNVIICINLLDEAEKKQIRVDCEKLSEKTGVPVVGAVARSKKGTEDLKSAIFKYVGSEDHLPFQIDYGEEIEKSIPAVCEKLNRYKNKIPPRWLALRLLEAYPEFKEDAFFHRLQLLLGDDLRKSDLLHVLSEEADRLEAAAISKEIMQERIAAAGIQTAEKICKNTVSTKGKDPNRKDRLLDKLFIGKKTAYPIMLLLLLGILWLTIIGANYPSAWLSALFSFAENKLSLLFMALDTPWWLKGLLIDGAFRTLSWIVSVMLPPMAIFFPLFTLLEDAGYLPRVAFNLDKPLHRCKSCGKQALSMCMGLGCNAAGVVGCRIIDSERERLIAMLTNCFMPCNGRFPLLIAVITMFFVGFGGGFSASLASALLLTALIALCVIMTLIISSLLSRTVLKGIPSSFTLELPPYRSPQIGKVIVRSVFDRTIFVLGRAVISAIPAGLLIWLMANLHFNGQTLLALASGFLDPFATLMGLDGVILLAFILGLPANEIVIPLIIMAYMSSTTLTDYTSLADLKNLLAANGWTSLTALCTMLFSLFHWPCATTILTIKKESRSLKWTLLGIFLPTAIGISLCMAVAFLFRFF